MRILTQTTRMFNQQHEDVPPKKQEDVLPKKHADVHQPKHKIASKFGHPIPLQVLNQAGPFCNFNAFDDVALRSGVIRHHGRWGLDLMEELGAKVGSQERLGGVGGFLFWKEQKGEVEGDDVCI